jgi:hypothetical protein
VAPVLFKLVQCRQCCKRYSMRWPMAEDKLAGAYTRFLGPLVLVVAVSAGLGFLAWYDW